MNVIDHQRSCNFLACFVALFFPLPVGQALAALLDYCLPAVLSLLPIIQIDIPWHWPWEYKSAHGWLTYFGFLEPSRSSSASWPPATCCLLQQMNRPFTLFWPLNTCDFHCCLNIHSSPLVVLQTSSLLHNNLHLYALHIAIQVSPQQLLLQ